MVGVLLDLGDNFAGLGETFYHSLAFLAATDGEFTFAEEVIRFFCPVEIP